MLSRGRDAAANTSPAMGSTSYLTKPRVGGRNAFSSYRPAKSGSSVGSDKENVGKSRKGKIRRSGKMNDYGVKRYPDYTELAYKEAVSKLRYFLAGNYAPSLRSYGGSASIKNLDESDADTAENKRYQPVPVSSAYGDFRTKPRPLTARYLNYYADSFKNNYGPGPTNTGSPTAATVTPERPSAANPELMGFIQKQEEYIEQLERESQYCRDELNTLLGKVKEVISENEHLHEAQKDKLLAGVLGGGSDSDERDDMADSVGLDSDSKISPSKSRRSGRSSRLHGPNIVFESRISELEAQLTESKIDLKKVQEENNENRRKLAEGIVDSSCLDGFKRQIENLQRDKNSLELQVSKLKNSVDSRQELDKDIGSRLRREHEGLEQQLREERNNLEAEIRSLKEELNSQRGKVRELTGEGARRVMQERNMAERRYAAHMEEMTHDLAAQYDTVGKLQLELERQRREESDLKRELAMKNSAIEELRNELKNKTASLQADIAQAQAEKSSMEEELANARLMMERQQRQAKHETNRLNSEIQSLRQRLDRADADVVHARRENLRLSDQIANLEKEMNMRNLRPTSPAVKDNKEKEFSNMIESMENKHAQTVSELESMIHSQNNLMDKLTGECRLLTDKLDDASRRHKEELATLQRQVNGLSQSIVQPSAVQRTAPVNTAPAQATPGNVYKADRDRAEGSPRSGGPRIQPPRHAPLSRQPSNASFRNLGPNGHDLSSKQSDQQLNFQNRDLTAEKASKDYDETEKLKPSLPPDKVDNKYDMDNAKDHVNTETYSTKEPEYPKTEYPQYTDPNPRQQTTDQQHYEQPAYTDEQNYEQNSADQYKDQYDHYDPNQQYPGGEHEQNYQEQTDQGYEQNYDPAAQVYDTNAQAYDTNAQAYDTNAQGYDTNAQAYDTNAQGYDTNAQAYDTNTQGYGTSAQAYNTDAQAYDTNTQKYDPNAQTYDTNAQSYGEDYDRDSGPMTKEESQKDTTDQGRIAQNSPTNKRS